MPRVPFPLTYLHVSHVSCDVSDRTELPSNGGINPFVQKVRRLLIAGLAHTVAAA